MVFNPLQQMALQALQASQNPTGFAQQAALTGQTPLSLFGPALSPGSGGALPGLGLGLPLSAGLPQPQPQSAPVPVGNSSVPLVGPPATQGGSGGPPQIGPPATIPPPGGFAGIPGGTPGGGPGAQHDPNSGRQEGVPPVPGGPQRRPLHDPNSGAGNFNAQVLERIRALQGGLQGIQNPSGVVAPPTPVAGTVSGVGGPAPNPQALFALIQALSGGAGLGAGIPPALGALIGGR